MKVLEDSKEYNDKLRAALKKHAWNPEHNFWHYTNQESEYCWNVVFDFGRGKMVMASHCWGDVWHLFPDGVLAPKEKRLEVLCQFLDHVLYRKNAKKVVVELSQEFREEVLKRFEKSRKFKALTLNFILHWPIYDMKRFDPKLCGKAWKKLRNINNRFRKMHSVRMVDSKKVPKEKLKALLKTWLRRRAHNDTVDEDYYYNMINCGFKGMTFAKTLYVDGEPCTITAGWKVPGKKSQYYSAIGVLNYRHRGLGEFANLKDLMLLKEKGYKFVDFGGSDYTLLNFKNKFRPSWVYKTYTFSIVAKKFYQPPNKKRKTVKHGRKKKIAGKRKRR